MSFGRVSCQQCVGSFCCCVVERYDFCVFKSSKSNGSLFIRSQNFTSLQTTFYNFVHTCIRILVYHPRALSHPTLKTISNTTYIFSLRRRLKTTIHMFYNFFKTLKQAVNFITKHAKGSTGPSNNNAKRSAWAGSEGTLAI